MANIYISADTGNDTTGTGTSALPYLTISKAHNMASDGDTIICKNSTAEYTFTNQTFTKSLTIQGEKIDGSGAVFNGNYNQVVWNTNLSNTLSLTVRYITLRQVSAQNAGQYRNLIDAKTLTVENCVFQEIRGVSNAGGQGGIVGCSIGYSSPSIFNLSGCLFWKFGDSKGATVSSGHYSGDIAQFRINNNTFVDDATAPDANPVMFYLYAGTSDIQFKNNIIYSDNNIKLFTMLSPSVFEYNCVYNTNNYLLTLGTGCITSDPLFVDKANGNFNLRPASPCIDTGTLI
jgi:hypothetical protein